jgi:hypothetical protein
VVPARSFPSNLGVTLLPNRIFSYRFRCDIEVDFAQLFGRFPLGGETLLKLCDLFILGHLDFLLALLCIAMCSLPSIHVQVSLL